MTHYPSYMRERPLLFPHSSYAVTGSTQLRYSAAKVTKEAIAGCVNDQLGWVSQAASLGPALPRGMARFLQATYRFPFPLHAVKKERYSGPQKLMTPRGE